MDPHCYDADPDPDPDPAQNLDADPDPGGWGGRSAKNVHPPWQNPRYAPATEDGSGSTHIRIYTNPYAKINFYMYLII